MPTSKSTGDSSKRGAASVDDKKKRELAGKGGKPAHGDSGSKASSTKGGTSGQHTKAGSQSHKNS